jgi:hypothetical protein
MEKAWQTALGLCGLAGVGAIVFLSLYKKWLSLDIFSKLSQRQTYKVFVLFLVLVFVFATLCVFFYAYSAKSIDDSRPPPNLGVAITKVDVAQDLCVFEGIARPYTIVAPIRNPGGVYWNFGGPPIGNPVQKVAMGSHQKFPRLDRLANNDFIGPMPKQVDEPPRSIDPVLDVILLNKSTIPKVLNRIGIRPIAAWTSPKGPPYSGKIISFDCYTLKIDCFKPFFDQWLILRDPVYIGSESPYRFKVNLLNLGRIVDRNEIVFSLLVDVDDSVIVSDDMYIGYY